MEITIKKMYRPKEARIYLGVSLATFWNYVKDGKIKTQKLSSRVTVVSIEELESFINSEVI